MADPTAPPPPDPSTAADQGRDGGLRPGDEHLDPDSPDVALALAALEDPDD